MKRILLIEDDQILGESLVDCFTLKSFDLYWAKSVTEARTVYHQPFDLALIDVTLPDGNGFELASELAQNNPMPFIFMTARNEAESRLRGYEMGALDYVPKPFHFKELLIRVEKILANSQAPSAAQLSKINIVLGERTINLAAQIVYAADKTVVPLSHKDFSVLKYLIERSPNIISRDELLDNIWGEDQFPTPRTVDNSIVRIRKALLDQEGNFIHSIRGQGYQIHLV